LDYSRHLTEEQQYDADQARLKSELETTYYRPGIDIQFKESMWGSDSLPKTALKPYWQRSVKKELAFIYLEKMHQKALQYGVPFKPLAYLDVLHDKKLYDYQIPDELRALYQQASEQGKGSKAYNQLYEGYIHHSHKHAGGLSDTIPDAPEENPDIAFGNYQREVYYGESTGLSATEQWEFNTNNNGIVQWYKK
jgi:hypothetical protein